MQKHSIAAKNGTIQTSIHEAAQLGTRAYEAVQSGAHRATASVQDTVRLHPLAAVGIAFGGGTVLGVLAYGLLRARR